MTGKMTASYRGRLAFRIFSFISSSHEKGLGVRVEDLLSMKLKASDSITIDDLIEILENMARAGVIMEIPVHVTSQKHRGFTLSDGWTFERTLYEARRLTREALQDEEGGLVIELPKGW